jgi:6-phosphogluconolactonase
LQTVPSGIEIAVVADPARFVAERLAAAARSGGQIVLAGGSTPRRAYELAAELERDWTRAGIWWGDERCVPPGDERSNYRLVEESLLSQVTPGSAHRIEGELGRTEGALRYEEELAPVEEFDLVLLGLGPDGHVASLFPNEPTLEETERRAVGAAAKLEPFVDRITLTLPMLRLTHTLLFLATGDAKAPAVHAAFAGAPSPAIPGSLVRAAAGGETIAVLDAAAAALLA